MLRNALVVSLGLVISISIILGSISIAKEWYTEIHSIPFQRWQKVLNLAPFEFFIAILISYSLSALIGGLFTGFFVHTAKQAYALLIGLILLFIAGVHVFLYSLPFWFEVSTFCVFFPSSWLGGKLATFTHRK